MICAAAGALWLFSSAVTHVWSVPSKLFLAGAALIVAVAAVWLVRPPLEIPSFTSHHLARVTARWPASMTDRAPRTVIFWAFAALLALFAAADLAREPRWRLAFVTTIVFTGVIAASIGLLQNATHARGIYWEKGPRLPGAFFGPFYHHTSAGAYLNSVWPLAAALTISGVRDGTRHTNWIAALGGVATLLLLVAHTGHISRFPQVIAVGALVGLLLWLRPWNLLPTQRTFRFGLLLAALGMVGLVGIFGAGKIHTIRARWSELKMPALLGQAETPPPAPPDTWPKRMRGDLFVASDHGGYVLGDRGAAYVAAWHAFERRPWLGWGPGGWIAAAAATSVDPFVRTFFLYLQFTHNDYLQTLVEWGLFGALGWALLVFGGLAHAFRRLARQPAFDLFGAGAIAALMALLVQSLVDFPLQIPAIQLNATMLTALAWSSCGTTDAVHS